MAVSAKAAEQELKTMVPLASSGTIELYLPGSEGCGGPASGPPAVVDRPDV